MEMRCYRTILHISYKDHVTSWEVCAKIQEAIGAHKYLLSIVKTRKLKWCGHVSRSSCLAKTPIRHSDSGKKKRQTEKEVGRQNEGKDRPRVRKVQEGGKEQRKMEETGCEVICGAPTTPNVKG